MFAMVWISLSPRPDRLIIIIWSDAMVAAFSNSLFSVSPQQQLNVGAGQNSPSWLQHEQQHLGLLSSIEHANEDDADSYHHMMSKQFKLATTIACQETTRSSWVAWPTSCAINNALAKMSKSTICIFSNYSLYHINNLMNCDTLLLYERANKLTPDFQFHLEPPSSEWRKGCLLFLFS